MDILMVMMTVKELIEKLEQYDGQLEVKIDIEAFGLLQDIEGVYLEERTPFYNKPNVVLVR